MNKEKLVNKYNKQVNMYENNGNNPTLAKWRSEIIPHAYGKVLEVGVGVGANFPYYDYANVQLTGVDFSPEMIKSARKAAIANNMDAALRVEDVDHLQFEENSFDCIVSTLTLCVYPNPIKTLENFKKWCKDDGKILLMEHGLSRNPILGLTQKVVDPLFKKVSGCHCDRNMLKLIKKAGLEVEQLKSYWAGIVNLMWVKPQKV